MVTLLDASVWVAAANPGEPFHQEAVSLAESGGLLAGLDLTLLEVANVVASRWHRAERAKLIVDTIVSRCGKRMVRVDREVLRVAIEIAAEHGLSAYDAAYVAVARRNGWTLVSTDFRDLVS